MKRALVLMLIVVLAAAAIGSALVSAETKELSFWAYGSDKNKTVETIAGEFTKKTGIKVNVIAVPKNDYVTKLNAAAANGIRPTWRI